MYGTTSENAILNEDIYSATRLNYYRADSESVIIFRHFYKKGIKQGMKQFFSKMTQFYFKNHLQKVFIVNLPFIFYVVSP